MSKFLNNFREKGNKAIRITRDIGQRVGQRASNFADKQTNKKENWNNGRIQNKKDDLLGENFEDFDEGMDGVGNDPYIDNVQPAQKPASFHHFILENKYQDLEKSIRGYKDVYNNQTREWEIKRKAKHCFTDEEAEELLRTAQSHLATDIKLTFYSKETLGVRFLAVYEKIEFLFKRIMEYRYGRYGSPKQQGEMKDQALKIFVELITRIEANYLRAIQGMENKRTHEAVQSQESLQGTDPDINSNSRLG